MNIGEPKRTIEIEPATLPLPEELPIAEPALVPAGVPTTRPEGRLRWIAPSAWDDARRSSMRSSGGGSGVYAGVRRGRHWRSMIISVETP